MEPLRVMGIRKNADTDYKLSSLRSFHSILKILKQYTDVKEIWMVENGGSDSRTYRENVDIYNVFSFNDFNEVMELLKPDLVMAFGGNYEFLERAMIKAAAARGIPTVTVLGSFIESWVATDGYAEGIVSGRLNALRDHGWKILRKYLFLLKTLFKARYGLRYIIRTIIKDVYLPFTSFSPIYSFGGADLNIISTPQWADKIQRKGVDRKTIVVTGDCSMDFIHEKLSSMVHRTTTNNRIEVLFVTSPMVEHGYWKPSMWKEAVTSVVRVINQQPRNKVNLRLKIHPKTEKVEAYKELINPIDPSIEIIQSADLLSLLNDSDVIVSFGSSSALFQAIVLGKPIYIMNIFNEDITKNVFLKEKIAVECRTTEDLISKINDKKYNLISRKHLDAFIEKTFYKFDGKCSERAVECIIPLLDNHLKVSTFNRNKSL